MNHVIFPALTCASISCYCCCPYNQFSNWMDKAWIPIYFLSESLNLILIVVRTDLPFPQATHLPKPCQPARDTAKHVHHTCRPFEEGFQDILTPSPGTPRIRWEYPFSVQAIISPTHFAVWFAGVSRRNREGRHVWCTLKGNLSRYKWRPFCQHQVTEQEELGRLAHSVGKDSV